MSKPIFNLFALLTPQQKRGAFKCLFVMMMLAFMETFAAYIVVSMATQITDSDGDPAVLVQLSIACVLVFMVKGALALLDSYVQNRWGQNLILDVKERLVVRYTKMNYADQVMLNSGDSLSVLYNDADIYMRMGLTSLGILLSEASVFVVLMGYLLYLQPLITGILLALFALMAVFFILFLIPMFRRWGKVVQETVKAGYQRALEILQSYKDILIFGKTEYFIDLYMQQSRLRSQVAIKSAVSQVLPRTIIELIFIVFFAGIVLSFIWLGYDIASITAVLSAYLYAGFRLLPGLNRIMVQLNSVKMSEASIERIVSELNAPYQEGVYLPAPDLTFDKTIDVEAVSFCYPDKEKNVLDGVNISIKKGEFIGIVGETGSGKSTLLHLLLGLLLPREGHVLIDGKYAANSPQWHSKIGYAAQNFHLVDGTIADNVAFGVPRELRDMALVEKVINDAQLDKFVAKLPHGINTEIGEQGSLVSGGERQRIALARALYIKPEILMLDEATSALDLETEKSIMGTVDCLKEKSLTIIAVTHRLETLRNADRILTIENGCIVKEMTASEVFSKALTPGKGKKK